MKTDLISRSELFNKLATVPIKAESVETTTEIFKIINSMQTEAVDIAESVVERICDGYCKFPQIVHDDNDLDRICDNCPMDKAVSGSVDVVHGYSEWLEKIVVMEEPVWLCEDTPCPEWCEENCNYSSIQAECLRHIYGEKVKP